jgi:hypothetical protein
MTRTIAGVSLTAGTPWRWRTIAADGTPGDWCETCDDALAQRVLLRQRIAWPTEWIAFGEVRTGSETLRARRGEGPPPPPESVLASIPETLVWDGRVLERHRVRAGADGAIRLTETFGQQNDGRTVFLFAAVDVARDRRIRIHTGADWQMGWWIDGRPVFDTFQGGNRYGLLDRGHEFEVDLSVGRHVMAVEVISGSGGWGFVSEATTGEAPREDDITFTLEAECRFDGGDPAAYRSLTLEAPQARRPTLNGQPVPVPLEGMRYDAVPGIPSERLRAGTNTLELAWTMEDCRRALRSYGFRWFRQSGESPRLRADGELTGQRDEDAAITTGPILNMAGTSFFTLTCRTNARVPVKLELEGRAERSKPGLLHRFRVDGLDAGNHVYRLGPDVGPNADASRTRGGAVCTLPAAAPFRFAVFGDVYPFDDTWSKVAGAVAAVRPALAVFSGDMVICGRNDRQWDEAFFGPAESLLANVPFYAVIGNHEDHSPLFNRIFMTPGDRLNWSQKVGPVLLVGLDGADDWREGGELAAWLERTLASSGAEFIFAFNHYPCWSSGGHGRLDEDGRPVEAAVRAARDIILPILERHGATAVFSGHDHCYERCEPPGGVTAIISAGAGSRLYNRSTHPQQNPYSEVFESVHHYCLLEVGDDRCELNAVALDGHLVDRRTWSPRSAR